MLIKVVMCTLLPFVFLFEGQRPVMRRRKMREGGREGGGEGEGEGARL